MKLSNNIAEFLLGFALMASAFFFGQLANSSVDCMDNSYHADRCEAAYDYKNYHYVHCDCRCWRYARSLDRGKCRRCLHYHVPRDLQIKPSRGVCLPSTKKGEKRKI